MSKTYQNFIGLTDEPDDIAFDRLAEDPGFPERDEELRENCQDVEVHLLPLGV